MEGLAASDRSTDRRTVIMMRRPSLLLGAEGDFGMLLGLSASLVVSGGGVDLVSGFLGAKTKIRCKAVLRGVVYLFGVRTTPGH